MLHVKQTIINYNKKEHKSIKLSGKSEEISPYQPFKINFFPYNKVNTNPNFPTNSTKMKKGKPRNQNSVKIIKLIE